MNQYEPCPEGESAENVIEFDVNFELPLSEGQPPKPGQYLLTVEGSQRGDSYRFRRELLRVNGREWS